MTETLKEKEKEKGKLLDEGECEIERAGNGTREANGKEQKKEAKKQKQKKMAVVENATSEIWQRKLKGKKNAREKCLPVIAG